MELEFRDRSLSASAPASSNDETQLHKVRSKSPGAPPVLDELTSQHGNDFSLDMDGQSANHKLSPLVAAIPTPADILHPPENFAMVAPGVYRSGFPKKKHFPFLHKLGLKSILFLAPEDYPDWHLDHMATHEMHLLQFGVSGNKEPFVEIDTDVMEGAVAALLDKRNHPVLIHCNKGKHRTGCLVGCMRKTMRWCITSIFDEYKRFAGKKSRRADQEFIELFETRQLLAEVDKIHAPPWLILDR